MHANWKYPDQLHLLISVFIVRLYNSFYNISAYHYENTPIQIYCKFHLKKQKIFGWKTLIFFTFLLENIDCGTHEYPQSMFSSKNKKNNVYPCKPQFYYVKVGFKGVKII